MAILVPDSVRSGSYQLVFDKMSARASYHEWRGPGQPGTLDIDLPATLIRPKDDATRLAIGTFRSDVHGVQKTLAFGGASPIPHTSVSFQVDVPSGWRGDRLTLGGEFQDTVAAAYEAHIGRVAIERIERKTPPPVPLPAFRFRVDRPQTLTVGPGVEVKVVPTTEPTVQLPAEIAWDSKRVLPDLSNEKAGLESLKTNVGALASFAGSTDPVRGSATMISLQEGPRMDADPHEIRLSFKLVKTRKHYPFQIPVRLTWRS